MTAAEQPELPARPSELAAYVAEIWSSPYVPHSDVDWARHHLAVRWPALRRALDELAAVHRRAHVPGPALRWLGDDGEAATLCGALDVDPESGRRDRMCVRPLLRDLACPVHGQRLPPTPETTRRTTGRPPGRAR